MKYEYRSTDVKDMTRFSFRVEKTSWSAMPRKIFEDLGLRTVEA